MPVALGVTAGASSLYQQETGTDNVIAGIPAFIESGDFDIADGQPFLHIGRGIPNFKANIRIESEASGDNWRYGTLRLDVQPDGGR